MERIVFLERHTLRAPLRTPSFEHRLRYYDETRPEEVLERLKDATVAIVNKTPLRADVLEVTRRLGRDVSARADRHAAQS